MASSVLDPSSLPQTVSATVSPLVLAELQDSSVGGQELNLLKGQPHFSLTSQDRRAFLQCNWYSRNGGSSVTRESCSRLESASQGSQGTRGSPYLQAIINLHGASNPLHSFLGQIQLWGAHSMRTAIHNHPRHGCSFEVTGNQSQNNWASCCCGIVWIPSSTSSLCSLNSYFPFFYTCPSFCYWQYKQLQSLFLSEIGR